MAILLLAVAALVPLAFLPGAVLFYDVTPKVVVLLAGTALASVWYAISPGGTPRPVRWLGVILALHVISLAISTLVSERPELSLSGTNWRRLGLVTQSGVAAYTFVAASVMSSRPVIRDWMLRAVAAAGTLAAIYGAMQYFGLDPWIDPAAYRIGEGEWMIVRPPSTMGHANYAAVVYLAGVFAGAAAGRPWAWTAIPICSIALILGGSRAALLGLIAGAVTWVLTQKWRPRRQHLLALTVVLIAAASFYFTPPGERLRARVRWSIEDARGGARLMLWAATLALAAERPLAGWGPETFTEVFVKRQPAELSAAYPDFYYESPHNVFLDALAGQGLPGLVLFAAVCVLALKSARGALLGSLVGMLVALQFNALTVPTALILYTVIAAAVSASGVETPRGLQPIPRSIARAIIAPLALVWCVFAALLCTWDWRLKRADQAIASGSIERAAHAWVAAERVKPYGASADLWYSRRLAQLVQSSTSPMTRGAALQQAIQAGERAARTSDEPQNAWYHLSTLHALAGNAADTERCLRAAIDAAPAWFKPRWTLARLLVLTGRLEEAERQASLAAKLDGGKHPEVSQTLAEVRTKTQK